MAIASVNPTTGETLRSFSPLTHAELAAKLDLSAQAFGDHRKTSFSYGSVRMIRAAEILEEEKEGFGRLMTLEMGKTVESATDELVRSVCTCRYYAEQAERFLADEIIETTASRSYVRYQP